jgi:hypothetical protein
MLQQFIDFGNRLVTGTSRKTAPSIVTSGQYRDLGKMLQAVRALPPAPYIPIEAADYNPREGIEIAMNCAGVTDARSPTPTLGTYGLTTCQGLAVYNRTTQTGGLVHLAQDPQDALHLAPASREALTLLLQAMRTNKLQTLEVRMTAGPSNDQLPFTFEILDILNATPNLRILASDTGTKNRVKAFGIDTRRWDEGLLKGGISCALPREQIIPGTPSMEQFREGIRHIVEIQAMRTANINPGELFDTRSNAPAPGVTRATPPRSNPNSLGQIRPMKLSQFWTSLLRR